MFLEFLVSFGLVILLQFLGNLEQSFEKLVDQLGVIRKVDFFLDFPFDCLFGEVFEIILFETFYEG